MKFEILKPFFFLFFLFFFSFFRTGLCFIKTQSTETRCYRTGKYTVCRRFPVSFSPEILQAGAMKGLKKKFNVDRTGSPLDESHVHSYSIPSRNANHHNINAWDFFNVRTDVNLTHVIAHMGFVRTPEESALKNDSGRKIPRCAGEWNLRQKLAGPDARPRHLC